MHFASVRNNTLRFIFPGVVKNNRCLGNPFLYSQFSQNFPFLYLLKIRPVIGVLHSHVMLSK